MQAQWRWALPILAGVLIALATVGAVQAAAATSEQMATAKARVGQEATRGLERYDARGRNAAAYVVYGTFDEGDPVSFRYKITFRTPGRYGDGKVVCRGKVVVSGKADDRKAQRGRLVRDRGSCR
jgi:hypothetical protein